MQHKQRKHFEVVELGTDSLTWETVRRLRKQVDDLEAELSASQMGNDYSWESHRRLIGEQQEEIARLQKKLTEMRLSMERNRALVIHSATYEERDRMPAVCDDCGHRCAQDELKQLAEIDDLGQRLNAGCEVPAGECPHCGSLAYLEPVAGMNWR